MMDVCCILELLYGCSQFKILNMCNYYIYLYKKINNNYNSLQSRFFFLISIYINIRKWSIISFQSKITSLNQFVFFSFLFFMC